MNYFSNQGPFNCVKLHRNFALKWECSTKEKEDLEGIWIRMKKASVWCFAFSFLLIFFFFFLIIEKHVKMLFDTIHETYKPLFFNNLFIKNGSHGTFIHLKIILLQCFQLSIFSKINGIQMDHKYQIYVNQAITNMEFNINFFFFFLRII